MYICERILMSFEYKYPLLYHTCNTMLFNHWPSSLGNYCLHLVGFFICPNRCFGAGQESNHKSQSYENPMKPKHLLLFMSRTRHGHSKHSTKASISCGDQWYLMLDAVITASISYLAKHFYYERTCNIYVGLWISIVLRSFVVQAIYNLINDHLIKIKFVMGVKISCLLVGKKFHYLM